MAKFASFKQTFCVESCVPREPQRNPSDCIDSMNMGNKSDTARNRTDNPIRPKKGADLTIGHSQSLGCGLIYEFSLDHPIVYKQVFLLVVRYRMERR